ncbi:MAG: Glyoxalase/bleomycin resistance protein/dioxygenase [Marmoricola sp.]|jgi:PhnB protein|nr:Glyoxalase/bleomycin resistance protein/dioxygenase [Marmoricola sp.]
MASRLNPYIMFGGNAREAMEFYQAALGGDLRMNTFAEFGSPGPDGDKIMHANLETPDGLTLMASDTPSGMERSSGTSISVSLSGDDTQKLRDYWDKLTDGAKVTMPLERQVWGDEYGQFTDRFETQWMVNIVGPAQE